MFCANCGNKMDENLKFCTKCGHRFLESNRKQEQFGKKIFYFSLGIFFLLIIIYFIYSISSEDKYIDDITLASSVVNIYCEGEEGEEMIGGSGTIFTDDGLNLTNAHILPASAKDDIYVDETLCYVILPDPYTGAPDEVYLAYPIIDENFSDEYDIAFLQIHDVYYDAEEDVVYGEYPKIFPAYVNKKQCYEDTVKLGEPVRVYGYPSINGGDNLTITDGVVSSLLVDEGLIITSAKVSPGNSGGLAVDQNGCMIGIPSMVLTEETQSLGVIISNDSINEFFDKIR